jgi:hypothetical protein
MKRRLFWLLALAGVVWLYLKRGGRRPQPVEHVPVPSADPAEELRRKLDETKEREGVDEVSYPAEPDPGPAEVIGVEKPSGPASHLAEPEPPHTEPAEPVEPSAPVVSEELDARRREIHERARSAADDMRGTGSE